MPTPPYELWIVIHFGNENPLMYCDHTRARCLDYIAERRAAGSDDVYIIYSADSVHESIPTSIITWENKNVR